MARWQPRRRVAIVGAALSDTGRVDDTTAWELHHQGASRALADAGLTKDDVDGFASTGVGSRQEDLAEGQKAFASGQRVEWRLR